MSRAKIVKNTSGNKLPDPDRDIHLYTNEGEYLGKLVFTTRSGSTTSVLEYGPDQQPHQPYPLKRKYRQS